MGRMSGHWLDFTQGWDSWFQRWADRSERRRSRSPHRTRDHGPDGARFKVVADERGVPEPERLLLRSLGADSRSSTTS